MPSLLSLPGGRGWSPYLLPQLQDDGWLCKSPTGNTCSQWYPEVL